MPDEIKYLPEAVHEEFARRMEEKDKRQDKRLELLEEGQKELRELSVSLAKMAVSVEAMAKELKAQGERLERIEAEPGDKWRKAVWIVITSLVSAAVGWALKGGM